METRITTKERSAEKKNRKHITIHDPKILVSATISTCAGCSILKNASKAEFCGHAVCSALSNRALPEHANECGPTVCRVIRHKGVKWERVENEADMTRWNIGGN
ncbi:hypothetical protein TNCV_4908941 [Trichonephila clavipes]|uniref:Uncharacterized protein n=1 Tax=Trichonephila clavipes TaxID=2585209 RepID=A0A8X6UZ10_TRICX|nr:hypothetical protein TNCV_4908941 [Trichonephila clavipes]